MAGIECGYCGATVEETETGYVHASDPTVTLTASPGDFATPLHRRGLPVNPVDVVDTRLGAEDVGCYVEGSRGWHGHAVMIGKAKAFGYPLSSVDAAIVTAYDTELIEDDGSIADAVHDIMDQAERWLNDHAVADGYAFGWHDGEWFLWSCETWREDDEPMSEMEYHAG